jgi:hypothetical protein
MECLKKLKRHSADCALLHVLVAKAPEVLKPPILRKMKTVRLTTQAVEHQEAHGASEVAFKVTNLSTDESECKMLLEVYLSGLNVLRQCGSRQPALLQQAASIIVQLLPFEA